MTKVLLAIETATELASVAIFYDGQIISREKKQYASHAKFILPMIHELIEQAKLSIKDLSGIVLGCGPGSFTGLRIASSVAQAIAYNIDLPVFRVSSLHAITHESYQRLLSINLGFEVKILSLLDARMQQVYWSIATDKSQIPIPFVNFSKDINIDEDNKKIVLAGVGYEPYKQFFPNNLQDNIIQEYEIYPHAKSLLSIVLQGRIAEEKYTQALPIYIRDNIVRG